MRVVTDSYYDGLEQRCLTDDCKFVVGPYSEEWTGSCPYCGGRVAFFQAFGSEKVRSVPIPLYRAREISYNAYLSRWEGSGI